MTDPTPAPKKKPRRTQLEIDAERAEKRAKAMSMRVAGASWDQIARQVGYSDRSTAAQAVKREIANIPKQAGDELRELEVNVLLQVRSAYWKSMREGDAASAGIVLGTHDRMVRLLGLETTVVDDTATSVKDALRGFIFDLDALDLGPTDALSSVIPEKPSDQAPATAKDADE